MHHRLAERRSDGKSYDFRYGEPAQRRPTWFVFVTFVPFVVPKSGLSEAADKSVRAPFAAAVLELETLNLKLRALCRSAPLRPKGTLTEVATLTATAPAQRRPTNQAGFPSPVRPR